MLSFAASIAAAETEQGSCTLRLTCVNILVDALRYQAPEPAGRGDALIALNRPPARMTQSLTSSEVED
jgi:hypothetical protein